MNAKLLEAQTQLRELQFQVNNPLTVEGQTLKVLDLMLQCQKELDQEVDRLEAIIRAMQARES